MTIKIADALLRVPPILAVVGSSLAYEVLPQGSKPPGLVYNEVGGAHPSPRLCSPSRTHKSRLQITSLAMSVGEAGDLIDLVYNTLLTAPTNSLIAGQKLISLWPDKRHDPKRDDSTGVWSAHQDYLLTFT